MSRGRGLVFVPDRFINLVAKHADLTGRVNAEPNLIAVDADHGNGDVVTNRKALARTAAQDKHIFDQSALTELWLRTRSQETRMQRTVFIKWFFAPTYAQAAFWNSEKPTQKT
jgi:hypothetical protein